MTLIAAWVAVDSRKPSSIYIMSDSRIAWKNNEVFDFGKKVFGCSNSPDIFGYAGDVLFPSIVLNQIVSLIDQGLLFDKDSTFKKKSQAVTKKLIESFRHYPKEISGLGKNGLFVIYCNRDMDGNFHCSKISWNIITKKWTFRTVPITSSSDKLLVLGTGYREFEINYDKYWDQSQRRTSRTIFHCFTDTLKNIKQQSCGGPPQLVGLYRKNNSIHFGIIYNKKRYFQGVQIDNLSNFNNIDWRNELFEICDGVTKMIKKGAQRQPNPMRS